MNKEKEIKKNEEKKSVKEILQEDENKVIDVKEIDRVFRIHLGRLPNENEINRFEGIKESEFKVLEDYVFSQEETIKNEEKVLGDNAKIKGDLANKKMKVEGQNNLDMMKSGIPMSLMPIAENGSMPISEQSMMAGQTEAPQKKAIQDGENFLVRFAK